jgi:hypothetical protein
LIVAKSKLSLQNQRIDLDHALFRHSPHFGQLATRRFVPIVKTVLGYLLGYLALAIFAMVAFGSGAPDVATWRRAFLIGGGAAVVELCVLWAIPKPANRLVVAANFYLAAGGLAFALKQWWLLEKYEKFGLSGILLAMLCVGLVTTFASKAGFVGMAAPPALIRRASYLLLGFVALGLASAQAFPAIDKGAGVIIITVLAYSQRAVRNWVSRQLKQEPAADAV